MIRFIFYLFAFTFTYYANAQSITVSGFITETGSKEILPFANVHLIAAKEGTSSNIFGFYSIQLPSNTEVEVQFSSVGYKTSILKIFADKNIELSVDLTPESKELDEVIVTSNEHELFEGRIGNVFLPIQMIKQVPGFIGEKDLMKTIQLLPGAQRGTEGSTALYIRGGGPGQNLIILDDAIVYNANHLFGFFSVFNGDAIKNVDYWKGGFPARYGGRISSVIDIQMKDGSKEKIHGEGGVGLISSRLTVEGPIQKNKSSFIVSTRRTYLDLLTTPFMSEDSKFSYRFVDFNAKLNFNINPKNKLFVSSYFGNDKLKTIDKSSKTLSTIETRTNLGWGNSTSSLRWNHLFSDKIFINTTFLFSSFNFYLTDKFTRTGTRANNTYSEFNSAITDYSIKSDFDYFISNKHAIRSGLIFTYHVYKPRGFESRDDVNSVNDKRIQEYRNTEFGIYVEDTWQLSIKSSLNAGIRVNGFQTSAKTYIVAEPRLNFSYTLIPNLKVNGSYARANQFVHLLSSTGIGLATDLWVPVTSKAPPEQVDIASIGLTKSFYKQGITLSVESYRKYLRNILAYKEGAAFLNIDAGAEDINWENNITTGQGVSYGTELLLQKNNGKISGWIGYTLSWTVHQFDELNYGKRFYPKYDSRHNITLVCIYKVSHKVLFSASWLFNTGNALTIPQAYYYGNFSNGTEFRTRIVQDVFIKEPITESIDRVPYFGSRNSFRGESYHRLDLSIQLHKKKKKHDRFWEFGLFNAYNRKNPFYYYLEATNDFSNSGQRIQLKKKSLFPILPSISYNFKF